VRVRRRAALVAASPILLTAVFAVAWGLLPPVHSCLSFLCPPNYDPGGANVFGSELFTPGQSIVMAIGIWAAAAVLGRGLLPAKSRWLVAGFGALVLASVITLTLPLPTTGPPPSVPCSTPGPSGQIVGRCPTGAPPVDSRLAERTGIVVAGLIALGVGALLDRRHRGDDSSRC
jgi:hypothetical protein